MLFLSVCNYRACFCIVIVMRIYNDKLEFNVDKIESKQSGKMTYYYANGNKINDTMNIDFICSCGKKVTITVKSYKKDSRLKCKACKTKETNLEKYGVENLLHSEKAKQTNFEKYGVDNFAKSKKAKNIISMKNKENANNALTKRKKTNLEKYGVEYSFQSEKVKEKIKQTNLKKYGGHPMLNSDIKDEAIRNHNIGYINNLKKRNDIKPLFDINNYQGFDIEYDWECKICGNKFQSKIYTGYIKKCPICYPNLSGSSQIEREISDYIKSLNVEIIENTKSIIPPHELDIYIPSHNLAIELNGLYWHSELQGKDKNYHINKTQKCLEKDIQLLHIFEDEWINKQEIIKNIIKMKLGLIENRLYARKCELKEIDNQKEFLNTYHIQGYISAKVNIGLYYENELVSLTTFGKSRFNKKYDWELLRFVNKSNYTVVGGFSKMLKYFTKNYSNSLITYSDRRLFDGQVYESSGFTKLKPSNPSYFYTDGRQHRFNRQKFQKHKLPQLLENFNKELTEWENMQINGWDRIWDCGNNVFAL